MNVDELKNIAEESSSFVCNGKVAIKKSDLSSVGMKLWGNAKQEGGLNHKSIDHLVWSVIDHNAREYPGQLNFIAESNHPNVGKIYIYKNMRCGRYTALSSELDLIRESVSTTFDLYFCEIKGGIVECISTEGLVISIIKPIESVGKVSLDCYVKSHNLDNKKEPKPKKKDNVIPVNFSPTLPQPQPQPKIAEVKIHFEDPLEELTALLEDYK